MYHFIHTSMKQCALSVRISCTLGIFLTLSGCAGMNADFNCPIKPGQTCNSLDQVNRMVDQGKIGNDARMKNTSYRTQNTASYRDVLHDIASDPLSALPASHSFNHPLRQGESVMRIWVAPYEDKAGHYYQPGTLYTVMRPGRWIGQ